MSEKPDVIADTVTSQFPEPDDIELNEKVEGIIRALGIDQTSDDDFVDTVEEELVTSVNSVARIGAQTLTLQPSITEDNIPDISEYPAEEQQKIIERKLRLYQKTQENIEREIERLLAISGSAGLSPSTATYVNHLISKMRSLGNKIELYTKRDQLLRQQQQQREAKMMLQNKRKKLAEKIKKQKKQIRETQDDLRKQGVSSFLLAGKWLDVYRKNLQERIQKLNTQLTASIKEQKKIAPKSKTETPTARTETKDAPAKRPVPRVVRAPASQTVKPMSQPKQPLQPRKFDQLFSKVEVEGREAPPTPTKLPPKVEKKVQDDRNKKFATERQNLTARQQRGSKKNG